MHRLIIISGPGGSGKDTVIEHLLKDRDLSMKKLVNYTSRHPRAGEVNGKDYHFLTREEFEREIKHGQMLEHEIMASNNHYYGTHKKTLMRELDKATIICKKMPAGSLELKKHFKHQAITIFIDADNSELEQRLLESNRSLEHATLKHRLEQAEAERKYKKQFDYNFTNHDGELDKTVQTIKSILQSKMTS